NLTDEEYWVEIQKNNDCPKNYIYEILGKCYRIKTYYIAEASFSGELTETEGYIYFIIGNLKESHKQFTKFELFDIVAEVNPYISEYDEKYEYIILLEGETSGEDILGYFYMNANMDALYFAAENGFYSGRK
ncbi:MAG: hypothetical protein LBK02_07015, partial [Treponema sp.]|nr:hypothetical protein [Treponema sp.]